MEGTMMEEVLSREQMPIPNTRADASTWYLKISRAFQPVYHVISSCVLRSHSEMGEIGHRTEKLLIVFELTQLITKGINNGFKRGKSTIIKGFFPYFLPNMLNGI